MATFTGTSAANHIVGTAAADIIRGYGGNDLLEGRGGNDSLYGGAGADTLNGGTGNDVLSGGGGNDLFLFAAGDGQDRVTDFASGDVFRVSGYSAAQSLTQVGSDVVLMLSATDNVTFSGASLATVQAALQFGSTTGGGGTTGGTITGTANGDVLNGTAGSDTIYGLGGYDVIHGGGGNDRIYGGLGGDALYGGAGADVFVYSSLAEAPPYGLIYYEWDTIYDFQSIDKIDFSAVDANTALSGKQAFHLSTSAADTSVGSLHVGVDGLYGFTDNSGHPTFYIGLMSGVVPTAANLIL